MTVRTAPKLDRLALTETLLRVVDAGSISAAARQLGTSQPTVSRRLQQLEAALGVTLLKRSTHALQLTDVGERYVLRARALLGDWQQFERSLRAEDEAPEGLLRVVVPHAFGQEQLLGPVIEYLRRYPSVQVEWRLYDGPVRLVEDAIDCIIRVGKLDSDTLIARKIHEVERIVVAAPALLEGRSYARPSQLEALPWLALETYYRNRVKLEREDKSESIHIRPRFITDSLFALRNAALSATGAAVISEWIVRDDLARGRLVQLAPRWRAPSLPVHIAWPRAQFYAPRLRRFIAMMDQVFAQR